MQALLEELFPICRSISGEGTRATLARLRDVVPLDQHEARSGERCFDWTVPDEWTIRDACIDDQHGNRMVDFSDNNLHVVGYSTPVDEVLSLEELRPHLHTLPDMPDAIPYRTSYYERDWGFCLRHTDYQGLTEGQYHVKIDSSFKRGSLPYGELRIPGRAPAEILLATNICHPSMANNELSGPIVLAFLGEWLLQQSTLNYSYRLLWLPETIGAIYYLSKNAAELRERVIAGYQVVCQGGPAAYTYLRSRAGNTLADRITPRILKRAGLDFRVLDYSHRGSDERQWCSPGVDLPVGSLIRCKYGDYPEYHTSLDNLEFVNGSQLEESLELYKKCMREIEDRRTYLRTKGLCEPNLGKRGLYNVLGGGNDGDADAQALLELLAFADGDHDLEDILQRSGISVERLKKAEKTLVEQELIEVTNCEL